jgi:hypothetical protein
MRKLMVFGVLTVFFLAISVPLMAAADWSLYGSVRMGTYYDNNDDDSIVGGVADDDGTIWDLAGNSRIGGNVKADAIGGRFEFAVDDAGGVTTRLLYATYNFGAGTLLIGQNYGPTGSTFLSNQAYGNDANLLNCGMAFDIRQPMVQVTVKGLSVALQQNEGANIGVGGGDVDITLPKIALKYAFKKDNLWANIFAGYQTYEIEAVADTYDVDSYVIGFGGGVTLGKAYVKAGAYMAQNGGQYGLWQLGVDDAQFIGGEVVDNDTVGGQLVAGMKASDKLALEAGVGYLAHEVDDSAYEKDESMVYYVQATYTFIPGVIIVPEFGVYDYKENSSEVDEGTKTYFGAKWQINF